MRMRNCSRILTPSSTLLNVHKVNDVGEIQIQTAEPLIPELTLLEVEISIEKLKK